LAGESGCRIALDSGSTREGGRNLPGQNMLVNTPWLFPSLLRVSVLPSRLPPPSLIRVAFLFEIFPGGAPFLIVGGVFCGRQTVNSRIRCRDHLTLEHTVPCRLLCPKFFRQISLSLRALFGEFRPSEVKSLSCLNRFHPVYVRSRVEHPPVSRFLVHLDEQRRSPVREQHTLPETPVFLRLGAFPRL
jgi:hypothetical protein